MTPRKVKTLLWLGIAAWVLLVVLCVPAQAEPVAQAQAHHGGSIVITDRRGNCPAGHLFSLDIRPAGHRIPFVTGCAIGVRDGMAITWTGWPRAFVYPRGAFRMTDRNLAWLD